MRTKSCPTPRSVGAINKGKLLPVDNPRRFLHIVNEIPRTLVAFRRILHVFRDIYFFCSSRFSFDFLELEFLILFTALLAVVQFQSQSPARQLNLWTSRRMEFLDNFIVTITVSTVYAHGDSCR